MEKEKGMAKVWIKFSPTNIFTLIMITVYFYKNISSHPSSL
jgi:hypothetical protein